MAQAFVRKVQQLQLQLFRRHCSVLLSQSNRWICHIFPPGSAKFMARMSVRLPLTSKTDASFIATINLKRPASLFQHRRLFSGTGSKFKARKSPKPDTWITRKQRSASERKLKAKLMCSCVLRDGGRCKVLTQGAAHTRCFMLLTVASWDPVWNRDVCASAQCLYYNQDNQEIREKVPK